MATTNGYPSGSESTTVASPASATIAAEITSLELFNNAEVDVLDVSYSSGKQAFLGTIIALGRMRGDASYKDLGLTEEVLDNNEIRWIEQDEEIRFVTLGAAATNVATTLTLVSTAGLNAGQILSAVETNENVRIVSVDSATVVTVARGQGSIAGTAMSNSLKLRVLGVAAPGGASNPTAFGSVGVPKSNYIQKFYDSVTITDFQSMTAKAGGNKKAFITKLMQNAYSEHRKKIELSAIFGQKSTGTDANGQPYFQTQGLFDVARQGWTSDISASLTRRTLDEALSTPMNYGSKTKILLCGTRVRPAISDLFYAGQVRTENIKGNNIDLTVEKLTVNGGEYIMVQHPYMDTINGLEKYALVVDLENFKVCYGSGVDMNGKSFTGKTRFEFDPRSTYANQSGDYVTYMGFKISNPNAFAAIKVVV
jgi:Family of unknown function (DUF5309)